MKFSPITDDSYYLNQIKNTVDTGKKNALNLLDYPPSYDKNKNIMKVKDLNEMQVREFKDFLNELYMKNINPVPFCKNGPNKSVIKYHEFDKSIREYKFRAVEVSCRILSHFDGSQNTNDNNQNTNISNTNLFRICSIKFKGEFQKMFEELVDKCLEKIEKKGATKNDAACFLDNRCNHPYNLSNWPCKMIENASLEKDTIHNLYESHRRCKKLNEKDHYLSICFYQRQLLGHVFLPFIDLSESKNCLINFDEEKEDDIDENGDNNAQKNHFTIDKDYFFQSIEEDDIPIFKNAFLLCTNDLKNDLRRSIMGIYKKDIDFDTENFFSLGNGQVTALIDFHLDMIGYGKQGVNLYIKKLPRTPIYCTNVKSEFDIPNAREYLTNLCLDNKDYQKRLIDDGFATKAMFRNDKICINKRKYDYDDNVFNNNRKKSKGKMKKEKEKSKFGEKSNELAVSKKDFATLHIYNNKKFKAKRKNIKINDSEDEDKNPNIQSSNEEGEEKEENKYILDHKNDNAENEGYVSTSEEESEEEEEEERLEEIEE